jgi:hypothetical protein
VPMIIHEGRPPLPVVYRDWAEWRGFRREDEPGVAPVATGTFCATCWGQGRLLSPARNGEGLVPVACPTCGGTRVAPPG